MTSASSSARLNSKRAEDKKEAGGLARCCESRVRGELKQIECRLNHRPVAIEIARVCIIHIAQQNASQTHAGIGSGFRGKFTERCRYVDYPEDCQSLQKLSITHDPAGAFNEHVTGLVIAGHTHCGQISLPFIGPLWVPSDAPALAHCGLYEDSKRSVFVTSGVGTSVLPLRFGAQSQWDELNISWN
jgi:hypothetical protein